MKRRIGIGNLALSIAILWVLSACEAVTLREAQDHFNKGAEMELHALDEALLGDDFAAHPGTALAAANEYRLANATASELIDKKSSALRQDRLLGATYVLKAMALWRISDLQGGALDDGEQPGAMATETVANPRQELLEVLGKIEELSNKPEGEKITLGTRDRVLHKALYGFYDHEGGRAAASYDQQRNWFASALKRLEESVDGGVPELHSVRVYIGSARLRTLATWRAARFRENKRCSGSSSCSASEMDQLNADDTAIKARTKEVVCGLKLFWNANDAIKDQLKKLLVPIGLPTVFRSCP